MLKKSTHSLSPIFYTQGGPTILLAGNGQELECTIDIAIILSSYRVILLEDLSKKMFEEIGGQEIFTPEKPRLR